MASLKFKEVMCLLYSGLLFISGLLLIAFSCVLLYKSFYHFKFVPSSTVGPFIVIFLLGFCHLFLTWLGIKGPTREHDFHIILFMVITVGLLIAECTVGIWSVILWDEVDVHTVTLMTESYDELIRRNFHRGDWAKLESKLKCCGLNGPAEYEQVQTFPFSCCDVELTNANATCPSLYHTGCKMPFVKYVKSLLIDAVIMGFCTAVLQGLGLFAFISFFRTLRTERSARMARRLEMQRSLSEGNGHNTLPASATRTPPVSASPPVSAPPPPPPTTTAA